MQDFDTAKGVLNQERITNALNCVPEHKVSGVGSNQSDAKLVAAHHTPTLQRAQKDEQEHRSCVFFCWSNHENALMCVSRNVLTASRR